MKRSFLALTSSFVVVVLIVFFVPVAFSEEMSAGQKSFMDNNCNNCHSIDAAKITKKMASSKAADLSTVGSTRDAEWMTKFLSKEMDLDGKKHMATWKGKPEELKTLVDWMASLKKK